MVRSSRSRSTGPWLWRPRVEEQVLHQFAERIHTGDDFPRDHRLLACRIMAGGHHLHGAPYAGERISDFVRQHRRHLADLGQRRLFAELLLDPLARAQIVEHAGELSLPIYDHLTKRQMQGNDRAVAVTPRHLSTDADDARVAVAQVALQIAAVFVTIRRRHQQRDILADGFVLGIAEQPLGRGIERLDSAAAVDHDDRVHRRLHDRSPSRLAAAQSRLELDARRQVVKDPGELPLPLNQHLADGQVQREHRTVKLQSLDLASDADDSRVTFLEIAGEIAVVGLPVWRGHEDRDVATEYLGFAVPKQPLRGRIEHLDSAPRIDHHNRVNGRLDDHGGQRSRKLASKSTHIDRNVVTIS
jgi:hypothetical protein